MSYAKARATGFDWRKPSSEGSRWYWYYCETSVITIIYLAIKIWITGAVCSASRTEDSAGRAENCRAIDWPGANSCAASLKIDAIDSACGECEASSARVLIKWELFISLGFEHAKEALLAFWSSRLSEGWSKEDRSLPSVVFCFCCRWRRWWEGFGLLKAWTC